MKSSWRSQCLQLLDILRLCSRGSTIQFAQRTNQTKIGRHSLGSINSFQGIIPENVTWGGNVLTTFAPDVLGQANTVFEQMQGDFMVSWNVAGLIDLYSALPFQL